MVFTFRVTVNNPDSGVLHPIKTTSTGSSDGEASKTSNQVSLVDPDE